MTGPKAATALRCPTCDARYDSDASFCALDGSKLAAADPGGDQLLGTVLAERYRIVKLIGQGGMGRVYRATHVNINKQFAIKVLRPEVTALPSTVVRFRQEARAASSIGHENIIQIEDFATLPDGSVYLAMEFLEGEPLDTRMGRTPALPLPEALDIAAQVGRGLYAAHEKGIVHRDLKPANVFLSRKPSVLALAGPSGVVAKILDFGIAKVSGVDATPALTQTGAIFGTPLYMSPEQAMGQPLDHRTDIYSMGVILYEMATGQVPFKADSAVQVLSQHIAGVVVAPSVAAPARQIPAALDAVVLKALAKEPGARFATMSELVTALSAVTAPSASRSVSAPVAVAAAVASSTTPPSPLAQSVPPLAAATTPPAPSLTSASPSSSKRGLVIGAVLLIGLLVGGAALLLRQPKAPGVPDLPVRALAPPAASPVGVVAPTAPPPVVVAAAPLPAKDTKEASGSTSAPKPSHGHHATTHAAAAPVKGTATPPTPAAPAPVAKPTAAAKPVAKPVAHPSAPTDAISASVEKLAQAKISGAHRVGSFYAGSATEDGQHSDWYMPLEMGKCYVFAASGEGSVTELYAYVWGPNGKRATDRQEGSPGVTIESTARSSRGNTIFRSRSPTAMGSTKRRCIKNSGCGIDFRLWTFREIERATD